MPAAAVRVLPGSFQPNWIRGCVVWLASYLGVTLAAGKVSAWADQSGAGNNFAQGTAGLQIPFLATGWARTKGALPALNPTTNAVYLQSGAGITLTGAWTFGSVFKISTIGEVYGWGVNSTASGNNDGLGLNWAGGGSIYLDYAVGANRSARTPASVAWQNDNAAHAALHTYNGTNATHLLSIDGVDQAPYGAVLSGNPGAGPRTDTFYIGNDAPVFTFGMIGLLPEFYAFSRLLTATETSQLVKRSRYLWETP